MKLEQYKYIFVPNRYENHPDHRAAYHIVIKNVRRQRVHPAIFEYEIWTPIRYVTRYLNITDDMEGKKQLISYYESQLKHIDYTSRVFGLNHYRGMQLNYEYAEAYRQVVDKFTQLMQQGATNIFRIYEHLIKKRKGI